MPYRYMKLYVGIFVLFFTLLFAGMVYLILDKKGVFEEKYTFHVYTESADAFHVGMPLLYSGFEIGQISDIELTENGKVHLMFEVKQSNHKWICEDTLLMLEKPLIGSTKIDVMSSLEYPLLKPDSIVSIIIRDDINDMITNVEPIINELETIVSSINSVTSALADEEGDLSVSMKNLRVFSERLGSNKALLTTITGEEKSAEVLRTALQDAALMTKEMRNVAEEFNAITKTLHNDVVQPSSASLKVIDAILRDIQQKLVAVDGTVKAIGSYDETILELKDEIRLGISKTNQMVEKIDALLQQKQRDEVELP